MSHRTGNEWLDDMIDTADLYIPFITEKAVSYHEGSPGELIIETNNGRKVSFDTFTHVCRYIPNDERLNDESVYRAEFGRRLRRVMTVRGITQDELSEKTGIPQTTISRYLCGKVTPSIFKVYQIAKVLECCVDDLMCRR